MVNQELLEILRCPVCVKNMVGDLQLYRESWLICQTCGRKYPILNEMSLPVMLISEGDKWRSIPLTDLPVPPPYPANSSVQE